MNARQTLIYIAGAVSVASGTASAQTVTPVTPTNPPRVSVTHGLRLATPRSVPFAPPPFLTFSNSHRYVDNYQQVQSYGRCVANICERYANGMLDATPNTVDERQAIVRLHSIGRACLSYGYRAPIVFIRGGIAEAMYRQIPAADAIHGQGVTTPDLIAFQASEVARGGARLVDDRRFTEAANCLVVRAPRATRSLLLSDHGSDAELAALNTMVAEASGCGNLKRFPVTGGRSFLRAYIAESAFHWARFNNSGNVKITNVGHAITPAAG